MITQLSNGASSPARLSVDEGSSLTSRRTSTIYKQPPHSVRTLTTGQTAHDPWQPVCADYTPLGHTAEGNIASVGVRVSQPNWTHSRVMRFRRSSQSSALVTPSDERVHFSLRSHRHCSPQELCLDIFAVVDGRRSLPAIPSSQTPSCLSARQCTTQSSKSFLFQQQRAKCSSLIISCN